jgi:hypothetical protein
LPSAATSLVRVLGDRSQVPKNPPCDPVARKTLPRPPHPVPYVRDDRETPLCVGRDAKSSRGDLGGVKTKIFLQKGLDTPVHKPPDGQITKQLREQIPLVSRMEINPSFRGARSASPESITTTGSMDSGPAPNGASTMCNCTSGNDAGVCGALRSIRGTTDAVGPDYLSARLRLLRRSDLCTLRKHKLTRRLTWALPVRQSHKRIFHESMLSI